MNHSSIQSRRPRSLAGNKSRKGVSVVFLTMMFPAVLGVAAYAINVSYMELGRTELQISTDLATRAAGRTLAVTGDQAQAIEAAERLLQANPFVNQSLTRNDVNIVFGVSTRYAEADRYNFAPGANPNAVRIETDGFVEVPMLFPTMGIDVKFQPVKSAISTQAELDIALVLDRSGSMAFAANEISTSGMPAAAPIGWTFGQAVPPNSRWLSLRTALDQFLGLIEESGHNELVSLTTYNHQSRIDRDLSNNYALIRSQMDLISSSFEGGATNIGDGILDGARTLGNKRFARPWASRVMIVLTDGNHNTGTDPILAAQTVAAQNIQIFTVTFSDEADIFRMQEVAKIGSGLHFHADGKNELIEVFHEIFNNLPTLITH